VPGPYNRKGGNEGIDDHEEVRDDATGTRMRLMYWLAGAEMMLTSVPPLFR